MRELYDLDYWIRQSLRDTKDPNHTREILEEALGQNAVEMGYVERADGSWLWMSVQWGSGVKSIEQVPYEAGER